MTSADPWAGRDNHCPVGIWRYRAGVLRRFVFQCNRVDCDSCQKRRLARWRWKLEKCMADSDHSVRALWVTPPEAHAVLARARRRHRGGMVFSLLQKGVPCSNEKTTFSVLVGTQTEGLEVADPSRLVTTLLTHGGRGRFYGAWRKLVSNQRHLPGGEGWEVMHDLPGSIKDSDLRRICDELAITWTEDDEGGTAVFCEKDDQRFPELRRRMWEAAK